MAFDFPSSPTVGQIHPTGAGLPSFQWNGAAWIGVGPAPVGRVTAEVKSSAYTVTLDDIGKLFLVSGSWLMSLPSAATAAIGFAIQLRNVGIGVITLDPNGSETVNGRTTMGLYPGESTELVCDGTGWRALFQGPVSLVEQKSPTLGQTEIDFTNLPDEFDRFQLEIDGIGVVTDGSSVMLRVQTGGTTWQTTGYTFAGMYVGPGGSVAGLGSTIDAYTGGIPLNKIGSNAISNAASAGLNATVTFNAKDTSNRRKFRFESDWLVSGLLDLFGSGCGGIGIATAITGVRLFSGSPQFKGQGRVKLYGFR